jgi:hypothetical protein
VVTSRKGKELLKSRAFKYRVRAKIVAGLQWCCVKGENGCKAGFRANKTKAVFWNFNPHHTCVDPPQDDLTQEELEEVKQDIAEILLEEVMSAPLPTTKATSKEANTPTGYN